MSLFKKTTEQQLQFNNFISKIDNIIKQFSSYSDIVQISDIEKIKNNFILKTEDFFRTDRKLNIGIIGQVKVGKSSFLNTLLFDGKEVLPKAVTPKTATLTKIEYSEKNYIEIEYYTKDEWNVLEKNAKSDLQTNEIAVAKEIMSMVNSNNINVNLYLSKKAASFIPIATEELNYELSNIKQMLNKRLSLLINNDKEKLEHQKKIITSQINNISSNLENIFGEVLVKVEKNKIETLKLMRDTTKEYSDLKEKEGIETHYRSYRVSDAKWYNPFSWGTSHIETSQYTERYYYFEVSDALESIRNFTNDCANYMEESFYKSVDILQLKKQILNLIIENFDMSDENYDPTYFKIITEKTLNNIEFPLLKIETKGFINLISNKFSGEIKNSDEKSKFKSILGETIVELLNHIINQFSNEILNFKNDITALKEQITNTLLENINNEFNLIINQYQNKEKEIKRYNSLLSLQIYNNI